MNRKPTFLLLLTTLTYEPALAETNTLLCSGEGKRMFNGAMSTRVFRDEFTINADYLNKKLTISNRIKADVMNTPSWGIISEKKCPDQNIASGITDTTLALQIRCHSNPDLDTHSWIINRIDGTYQYSGKNIYIHKSIIDGEISDVIDTTISKGKCAKGSDRQF